MLVVAPQISAGTAPAQVLDRSTLEERRRHLAERVAKLDETVAHAASRTLQLNICGHMNRAPLFRSDGLDSRIHGADSHTSSSRFGLIGHTRIKPGWSTGYRLEFETPFPSSDEAFNGSAGEDELTADRGLSLPGGAGEPGRLQSEQDGEALCRVVAGICGGSRHPALKGKHAPIRAG